MFVAGETRIISNVRDGEERRGRLNVLCKLAHWLCRCKDWGLVRGLFEAIIESVEMGEALWTDDFSHYEMMLPAGAGQMMEVKREWEEHRKPKERKIEVYWCKAYQRGGCTDKSPHMAHIRAEDPPVPVIHMCAHCFQRDNRREDHPEQDCPSKK